MKITDYKKIEELKTLIVEHLRALEMIEQSQVVNDHDLEVIIAAMAELHIEMAKKGTEQEVINYLITYIIGLWGRLIIDYGAKFEDL